MKYPMGESQFEGSCSYAESGSKARQPGPLSGPHLSPSLIVKAGANPECFWWQDLDPQYNVPENIFAETARAGIILSIIIEGQVRLLEMSQGERKAEWVKLNSEM